MLPTPFTQYLATNAGEVSEGTEKHSFLPKLFSDISGKVLTEQNTNVFLEIFPPLGAVL